MDKHDDGHVFLELEDNGSQRVFVCVCAFYFDY